MRQIVPKQQRSLTYIKVTPPVPTEANGVRPSAALENSTIIFPMFGATLFSHTVLDVIVCLATGQST